MFIFTWTEPFHIRFALTGKAVQHAKVQDIASFQLAPKTGPFAFAAFILGKKVDFIFWRSVLIKFTLHPDPKGMPSAARLYTAPNYDAPVCNKSFYNADKVVMTWNKQGTDGS